MMYPSTDELACVLFVREMRVKAKNEKAGGPWSDSIASREKPAAGDYPFTDNVSLRPPRSPGFSQGP
jgi:hypothetical protein